MQRARTAGATQRPERPTRRRCCACCGIPAAVALAVGAYLTYRALIIPVPPPLPPPAEQVWVQERMRQIRRETRAIEQDAAAGRPHPFSLTIDEAELNTYLATDADVRAMLELEHIRRAFVRIADGRVVATAVRGTGGPDVALSAAFVPRVLPDGSVRFRVVSVDVGQLPVPVARVRRLAEEMARSLTAGVVRPGVRFREVAVVGDRITAAGDTGAGTRGTAVQPSRSWSR